MGHGNRASDFGGTALTFADNPCEVRAESRSDFGGTALAFADNPREVFA